MIIIWDKGGKGVYPNLSVAKQTRPIIQAKGNDFTAESRGL